MKDDGSTAKQEEVEPRSWWWFQVQQLNTPAVWREMEPDKTNLQFSGSNFGRVWRCKKPGTLYLSVIFLCRSCILVFWCNSKCTHAKIKFGCSNIIRAQCVHHLQQTVPFSMLSYTSIFPFVRKKHITRGSFPHLNCPLPIFAHGFRSPGSNTDRRRWCDQNGRTQRWIFGEVDAVSCHPTLDQGCTSRWWFKMSSFFWQVRHGGWN